MNILEEICKNKIEEIKFDKKKYSLNTLEKIVKLKPNRGFKDLLIENNINKKNNIIAEIKKSSPSAGEIIKNYDPSFIANEYEKSGIKSISILTDKKYFSGNLEDLSIVSKKTNIPILRKDFILDPYQVAQSKFYNADAILLIMSILSINQAKEILEAAKEYKVDSIIEIHNLSEIDNAVKLNYPIIGINNRNLDTLEVDINNAINLSKNIPKEFTIIAESGIKSKEHIEEYNKNDIYNFLIGENLLKSDNLSLKISNLLNN